MNSGWDICVYIGEDLYLKVIVTYWFFNVTAVCI